MAAKTTILKENGTDDILYPVTKVGAVYTDDGVTPIGDWVDDINDAQYHMAISTDDTKTPTSGVEFTSADTELSPTSTESVELLNDSDIWSARLYKISQMFKNIRYLLKMLGSTDISSIGNGTVTGALSSLNGNLSPTSISRPTIYQSRVSIAAGGYIKVGRMVVVDIQVTAALSSYSGGAIFTGFPASSGTNSISAYVLDGSNQVPMGAHISSSGNMTITSPSGVSMNGKDMFIAGTYIAN